MLLKALDYSNSLLSLLPAYRSRCLSLSLSLIEDSRYPTKCLYALSLVHTGGCQKKGKEITHRNDACVSSSCQICCRDSMRRSITPHTRYLYPGLYPHPKGKYHHLLCTHGAMLPIFASVSFKAVVIVVIIYYYFGSEKIVSTDSIGALQRAACWDSWTRHVTLRILVLTNHAHTHVYNQCIQFTFEICWVWLILVKFLLNMFSEVCRCIKCPSALPCMPCCILCLPSADPFITLFFEVTPRGGATTAWHPLTFCSLVTFDIWLKRGREQEAGRVYYFLFRLPLSGPAGDGGDDMHVCACLMFAKGVCRFYCS